jgi:hypothetical protein
VLSEAPAVVEKTAAPFLFVHGNNCVVPDSLVAILLGK